MPSRTEDLVTSWLEQAARFIIGLPIKERPTTMFLAQLMSSGLDVDKLDYMAREALFSGIRLEIDTDRIFDKLRVFNLKSTSLPGSLASCKRFFAAGDTFSVLGLARGGQFAFEEFCIARVALYEKIYLHQKIRAAEAQLSGYLNRLYSYNNLYDYKEAHRWLYLKESFLEHPELQLPEVSSGPLFSKPNIHDLGFSKFSERNILCRAFAFGPANSLSDPPTSSKPSDLFNLPSVEFIESVSKDIHDFQKRIIAEVKKISLLLELTISEDLSEELIIDLPQYSNVQQGHDSIHFDKPPRIPLRWTMPIDKIVDYYLRNRALSYVFAPRGECPIVMLAVEKIVWEESKSIFDQEGVVAKKDFVESNKLRKQLTEKGYYDTSQSLKPISKYLLSAEAQDLIQKICMSLSQFESFNHQRITVAHVTNFLTQFPEDLQDVAINFLEHVEIIDETKLALAIKEAFDSPPLLTTGKIALVPLGGISDSATHLIYPLREIARQTSPRLPELGMLNDGIVLKVDHLVFFDDNVNSGLQVLNIFADWLDIKLPEKLNLNEEHVQALSDEAKSRLKDLPITLIFGVGSDGSNANVIDLLTRHLDMKSENINIIIHRQLLNSQKIFSGTESIFQAKKKNRLRDFLREIGEKLLIEEGKAIVNAGNKALGYGGAEAMICFPYNVPTMTITALWCSGSIDGREWTSLVERRRRRKLDGSLTGEDV